MHPLAVSYTRRTFTRAQRCEAAARNVQGYGSIHAVASLALDVIRDAGSGERVLPPAIRGAMELRNVAIRNPLSSISGSAPDGNSEAIREHLLALASPSRNNDVVVWVVDEWLRDRLDAHEKALAELSFNNPKLYNALFEPTLYKAIRIGKRSNIDRPRLVRLLVDQARFVLVAAAHDRIAHVRRMATSPHGGHFSGFNCWKFTGHVLLATVAEPALVVEEVYRVASTFESDDGAVRTELVGKELLPDNDAGAFVFDAALAAHASMMYDEPVGQVWMFLDRTAGPLARVARITSQDAADEGLARSSMTSQWFGLEPTEIATYVAIELLKALQALDALVDAVLDGRKPVPTEQKFSDNKVTFSAILLRAEGKPDRQSLQLGESGGAVCGLDPSNQSGRGPLVSMTRKLRDPDVAGRVAATFAIDPSRLFKP